jgi:hypothetical protein
LTESAQLIATLTLTSALLSLFVDSDFHSFIFDAVDNTSEKCLSYDFCTNVHEFDYRKHYFFYQNCMERFSNVEIQLWASNTEH